MTRVKVCGLATEGSVAAVNGAGVDFVGFNFWPRSKRYVTPERAAELAAALDPGIERVGLFVDAAEHEVRAAIDALRLDLLQFHGDESPEVCRRYGRPFMKAFRLRDAAVIDTIADYLDGPEHPFLVDAFVPGHVGGTGAAIDRELARRARDVGERMFLAGGLKPSNVASAIAEVAPWAVDVASGVEAGPGDKSAELVRAFVEAAHR